MTNYRRLPLKSLKNCRELGGFPTKDGAVTKYGVFLRCEIPRDLPAEDIEFLRNYGVTDCMDFRSSGELQRIKNYMSCLDFVDYHLLPMFGSGQVAPQAQTKKEKKEFVFQDWQTVYCDMLDNFKDWTKKIIETAARAEGACLYNCTTGKDRTGLCTMLLLSIAGVDKEDIVADYCVSMIYMRDVYDTIDFGGPLEPKFRLTPPDAMGDTIDYLEGKYGSVTDYIRTCGVSDETIEKIRAKFVE